MASVTMRAIQKAYDDKTLVIKGVDLDIQDGEFLVLVGPSGCGKSTLLRLIAGLEEITSGTMSIGERVVNDVAPRDRGVGMVFQSYALYPHMTVRQNMAFGLKIRKTDPKLIDARVREASALLALDPLLDRLPKQLSGGQRQRVAIGRAIVRQPDVFLFDEPLSNLDASLRTQMRIELKKLHRRLGATMIYVTHDQVEAMTLADRIAIFHDGHMQQVGTPDEVYNHPANRFVASFIGSPGMNFLSGEVRDGRFIAPGVSLPLPASAAPVTVGVRPQHLHLRRDDAEALATDQGTITATLDVIEPMGWEAYLHMTLGDATLTAHVEAEQLAGLKPGDALTFTAPAERLHLFDVAGVRIND